MARPTAALSPQVARRLRQFGDRLRLARRRRQLTAKVIAERAGMTPFTLRRVERGEPGVTMAADLGVLHVLGMAADLDSLAADYRVGRDLQDATLRTSRDAAPAHAAPPIALTDQTPRTERRRVAIPRTRRDGPISPDELLPLIDR